MSFQNMYQELLGLPGMNLSLAKTRLNESFLKIQNENSFSFQCVNGGWLTANMLGGPNANFLSPGTITVVPFTTTITADAVATAAWTAPVPYPPLLTQQQIRIPLYAHLRHYRARKQWNCCLCDDYKFWFFSDARNIFYSSSDADDVEAVLVS